MNINFIGKKALVTGAGKGIGRAIAKKLVECKADTIALSRTQADLDSLKQETTSIQTVQCDLADWDATRKAVQDVGDVDLLVNNAAVPCNSHFLDITKEDLDRSYAVNVFAVYNVTQVVAKGMVRRNKGGAIVNISSIAGKAGYPNGTVYGGTKAAVENFARSFAVDMGKHQIRINNVRPTAIWTDMYQEYLKTQGQAGHDTMVGRHPLGQLPAVDDVVNAVLFLLSDKAAMINGVDLPVDAGLLCNFLNK